MPKVQVMGSLQPVNFSISQRTSEQQGLEKIMKNTIRFAAVAALAVSAVAAQAAGFDFTGDHYPVQEQSQSQLTRAEVSNQVKQAVANHTMPLQGDQYVVPTAQKGSSLSREQVRQEAAAAEAAGLLNFGA
jgi:hypothetical protein